MANPNKLIRPQLTPGQNAAQGIRQLQLTLNNDYGRHYYSQPRPLDKAVEAAADLGLPWGTQVARGNPGNLEPARSAELLMNSPNRDELLTKMRQLLIDQGVQDGAVVPLAQGAESIVFATPDNRVVKLGTPASRFTYRNEEFPPNDVWGVLPIDRHSVATSNAKVPELWEMWLQPRAMTGVATEKDLDTLKYALDQQGWSWNDDHLGNIGMLPGKAYRPVVIDGLVSPTLRAKRFPFVPPTGPMYSVAGAAAAGAAADTQRDDETQVTTQRQLRNYLDPQPLSGLLAK